jgi:hypothetical protein
MMGSWGARYILNGAVNRKGASMLVSALPVSWIWLEVAFLALLVRLTLAREANVGVTSKATAGLAPGRGILELEASNQAIR